MTRLAVIFFSALLPLLALGQGGDQQLRTKADALFTEQRFAEALPLYSQLVSLTPGDRDLNYRFGACLLFGGEDKEKAIGHLKYATEAPATDIRAWYWLGRAYHLNYRFKDAQAAYQRFLGTDDKKAIAEWPVDALQKQCRNGEKLLNNLKEITVRNKVEVDDVEFFRFYDLADIGGRIVVLPDELKSTLDKKSKQRSLVYLPERGGPIYFSSYGKDGKTGRDIYRTELMPDGTFATPLKLAGYINTDQDEDYAFPHPDGKTFYFSSKGHNSMGGYDVFRAAYDKGMDAFGRPENLDFAVNTPDDDILYLVDPEGKEACFASARSSRQGKVHVYRVATAQLPLVITVFKGTYASAFDAADRKARIVVEDALSGEQVADVRTDMNGDYVLSLPRSGRFRFKVECGPSGRTHGGMVDVPRSDGPRAYRQELALTKEADLEKLVIRNYFDSPLEDDLVALALDEIKRRARLDVTGERTAVPQPETTPPPVGDIMTRAGFTGDIDEVKAVALAKEDATELERTAEELDAQAKEAFSIAVEAAASSDASAREAEAQVQAAQKLANEDEKNAAMVEAARSRQRSREASMRAKAAYRTGQDLATDALSTRQRAAAANKLATDLQAALTTKQEATALQHLGTLKQRLDTKSGAAQELEAAEKARRAVTAQEKEAARLLSIANAKRAEESELADRLGRSKRELADTRNRSRKEELEREIAELDMQVTYLRRETEAAIANANVAEKETAVLRGQASLTKHLTAAVERGPVTELSDDQVSALGQRIAGTSSKIEGLGIDERFDAQLTASAQEMEARTFDWDLASTGAGSGSPRSATQAMERSTTGNATTVDGRTTTMDQPSIGDRTPENADVADVPVTSDSNEDLSQGPDALANSTASVGGTAIQEAEEPAGGAVNAQNPAAEQRGQGDQGDGNAVEQNVAERTTERDVALNTSGTSGGSSTDQQATSSRADPTRAAPDVPTSATDRFLLENRRDELKQLISAERDRSEREELQRELASTEDRLVALDNAAAAAAPEVPATNDPDELAQVEIDPSRPPLVFDPDIQDAALTAMLYRDYEADKSQLLKLADADERAAGLNGLELMLADSVREEMARQVQLLELAPARAEEILSRVSRLRDLRMAHMALADQHLKDRQDEIAMLSGSAGDTPSTTDVALTAQGSGPDPINDRFVAIEALPNEVYASTVEFRATTINDAVAFKDADLARMDDLSARIDSIENALVGAPRDKTYDRKRRDADRMIDERLIIRTDLGQRTAFLVKEEWRAGTDSLKGLDKQITARGFAPTEPLLIMAQDQRSRGQDLLDQGAQLRKRADRIDDIVLRDSLYRTAYRTELEALRELDRSITVRNYLLGKDHQRGETLSYEQVAAKLFGIQLTVPEPAVPLLANGQQPVRSDERPSTANTSTTPEPTIADGTSNSTSADTARIASVERPVTSPSTSGTTTTEQATTVRGEVAPTPASGPTSITSNAALDEQLRQLEQRVAAQQRTPAAMYERFLGGESTVISTEAMDPAADPQLFAVRAEGSRKEAADLEQRALLLADQATAYADSATTARKRDRERLETLATRTRLTSDSLQVASVTQSKRAIELEVKQREAEQARMFRERLVKFYYLNGEEQQLVMENPDQSRYFQARTRALEQYDVAAEAVNAAQSDREVSALLREQVRVINTDAGEGRLPAAAAAERTALLEARATALEAHADSLDLVADRLKGAASINERQASVMLQAMPADNSTALMALEMRTRRTEPLLAEARDQAGVARTSSVEPPSAAEPTPPTPPSVEPGQEVAERPAEEVPTSRPSNASMSRPEVGSVNTLRMPDELVADIFELRPAAERRAEPIPMDAEIPRGIVFKVQIGAFRNAVPVQAFSDMTPVMGETVGNGLVRYTAGLFTGFDQAAQAKDLVRERGYRDAFVVAYRDGQRIPLGEAMRAARAEQQVAQQRTGSATRTQPVASVPAPTVRPEPAAPVAIIQAPAQPLPAAATEDITTVLARYPSTAEAIVDAFTPAPDATDYYNVPGAAPARQVETIKGLFFTVQVGVYSKPVPLDKLFNITPLNSERTETAKVRYTTGLYLDLDRARARKDEAVGLGVKDAFITAYLNGKRIPMREANALLERFGPSILAKP